MTPPSSHDLRLQLALSAARDAGQKTLEWFRQPSLQVERKGDGSPVTAADRAAEKLLRQEIATHFPEDAVLGEELGETPGTSGYRWALDPIDGTKAFITGVPIYTTLVAVLRDDQPYLGVVYSPASREIVYALAGDSTWYQNGDEPSRPAHVAEVDDLAYATFLTSEVNSFDRERPHGARSVYEQLESQCRLTRTWGDGYGYLLVATGRAHLMIDPRMNLWDAAAVHPVITGAGGAFCDWRGRERVDSGEAIACSPGLREAVLAITRSAAPLDAER